MKVDFNKARCPEEEYTYWSRKLFNYIDEKLPWDMHPNELRAQSMYKTKMKKKALNALALIQLMEHN